MSEQFNPRAAVKSIKRGNGAFQYMQVKDRVQWFRTDNPEGVVQSELVRWDAELGVAVVLATVTAPGLGVAQALGSACRKDLEGKVAAKQAQPDQVESYVEFAETAAVGRALGRLGYGTEDALDVTPVDSPHDTGPQEARPREQPQEARNGRQATQHTPTPARAASPPADGRSESPAPGPSTHEQHTQIRDLVGPAGMTIDALLQTQGLTSLSEMSTAKAERVIARLKERAAHFTPDADSPVADTPRLTAVR